LYHCAPLTAPFQAGTLALLEFIEGCTFGRQLGNYAEGKKQIMQKKRLFALATTIILCAMTLNGSASAERAKRSSHCSGPNCWDRQLHKDHYGRQIHNRHPADMGHNVSVKIFQKKF
jgi:hypothetical protein